MLSMEKKIQEIVDIWFKNKPIYEVLDSTETSVTIKIGEQRHILKEGSAWFNFDENMEMQFSMPYILENEK